VADETENKAVDDCAPNVCQYWSPTEPVVCEHWDDVRGVCTFEGDDGERAQYYPPCNLIGTKNVCSRYTLSEEDLEEEKNTEARCILPDPTRYVVNRQTGEKWVDPPEIDPDGKVIKSIDYSLITEYNAGSCDRAGTSTTCDGYSPYHLGFGNIQPDDSSSSLKYDLTEFTSIHSKEMVFRLPLNYVIYNIRPQLSRCFWWKEDPELFKVNEDTGIVKGVDFYCTAASIDEIVLNYEHFTFDQETKMSRAPCNGAKPECPHYTGVCWQYCIDCKTQDGDKVLAEQILELRYYIRRERWPEGNEYEKSFIEPDIYAWKQDETGSGGITYQLPNQFQDLKYEIPTHETSISSFDPFEIAHADMLLTEGITAREGPGRGFPDKVRELKDPVLSPIIRNKFAQHNGSNIFESPDIDHDTILIFGDTFWYDSLTYGINLSNPDLDFFPDTLKEHDNMSELKAALIGPEGDTTLFDLVYGKLDSALEFMIANMPEDLVLSELGRYTNMFYIDVSTSWNENEIFVFNKGSGRWEFDKVTVNKIFCGGVISQKYFLVEGKGKVSELPLYEADFATDLNNNGLVSFSFSPMFISEGTDQTDTVAYTYLDGVLKRPPATLAGSLEFYYDTTYKLYELTLPFAGIIDIGDIRFFGNAGYAMVDIPDEKQVLSTAIRDWEIEGDLWLVQTAINEEGEEEEVDSIKMEIVEKCNSRIELDQMIIKPENIEDFHAVCEGHLAIEKLFTYERRTQEKPYYGDDIDVEEVLEPFITSTTSGNDISAVLDISLEDGEIVIRKFGAQPLMPAVVFRGPSGRIKGHAKTKLIAYVRQPYCRDVEIDYTWNANYNEITMVPYDTCYGTTGFEERGTKKRGYRPPCGDHNLLVRTGLGPMWYPYDDCDDVASYRVITRVTEYDTNVMEIFGPRWNDLVAESEEEDYEGEADSSLVLHGAWDMRMLGPSDNFGWTCDVHARLWTCLCDWTFCNATKVTDNIYTGYSRYRGGVTGAEYEKMVRFGGSAPKFGNAYRDFLRSYRSMDVVYYYIGSGRGIVRVRKWVPMNEFYTSSDLSNSTNDYPYMLGCSNDYVDDNSTFTHPMGMMTVDDSIEKVAIAELISGDRFRFEDVFRTHSTTAGVYYPYPKEPQFKEINGLLVPIVHWFTYKDYTGDDETEGDGNDANDYAKSVQWAWQEKWKDMDRTLLGYQNIDFAVEGYAGPHRVIGRGDDVYVEESKIMLPYNAVGEGRHLFLDVLYPEYKYDFDLKEHRLVMDEGFHTIYIKPPPPKSKDNPYYFGEDPYWSVQLNTNLARCFDKNGDWGYPSDGIGPEYDDDAEGEKSGCKVNAPIYDECTAPPWVSDVTIFSEFYSETQSAAEDDGRVIVTYDSIGIEQKEYYQRGLDIRIKDDKFKYLPRTVELLEAKEYYNFRFSEVPGQCLDDDAAIDNNYTQIPSNSLDHWWPATQEVKLTYCSNDVDSEPGEVSEYITIDFKFIRGEDDKKKQLSIGAVAIDYDFGTTEGEFIPASGVGFSEWTGTLHHVPGIQVFKSENDLVYEEIYILDKMELAVSSVAPKAMIDAQKKKEEGEEVEPIEGDETLETVRTYYEVGEASSDIVESYTYLRILLRVKPTKLEIDDKEALNMYYDRTQGVVHIKSIYIYANNFIKASEPIDTYERKYRVTYGGHGDFPPHGDDSTGSLLYVQPVDRSSVYQLDSHGGVVGMPGSDGELATMNKVRGRIAQPTRQAYPYKVRVDGRQEVPNFEAQQKTIHDKVVDSGNTGFTMSSIVPPGTQDQLDETGSYFPNWKCTFANEMVRPLIAINGYERYSPKGHEYIIEVDSLVKRSGCSRGPGLIFGRVTADVYEYVFINSWEHSNYRIEEISPIVAYYGGIQRILFDPWYYLDPHAGRTEITSTSNKRYSALKDEQTMKFRDKVYPIVI